MSAQAKNLAALNAALARHDANCREPAQEICMHPVEVERLGWDSYPWAGGEIPISGDSRLATGTFRVVCARTRGGNEAEAEAEAPAPAVPRRVPAHA